MNTTILPQRGAAVDHRDVALEDLAADEAELRDLLRETRAVCDGYRLMTSVALSRLHCLTTTIARQNQIITRLVDESRRLRAAALCDLEAA